MECSVESPPRGRAHIPRMAADDARKRPHPAPEKMRLFDVVRVADGARRQIARHAQWQRIASRGRVNASVKEVGTRLLQVREEREAPREVAIVVSHLGRQYAPVLRRVSVPFGTPEPPPRAHHAALTWSAAQ